MLAQAAASAGTRSPVPPCPALRGSHAAEEEAVKALEAFPGVSVINDRANNRFPTPLDASNMDNVYVGR